jgi:phosphoribosylaminoimidazole carboxylase PurE protein
MAKKDSKVLIVIGSASDAEVMSKCAAVLDEFGVGNEFTVASAHRSPARAEKLAREAAGRGTRVIVAAAGMAAALAGVMAANTDLPVIGVPLAGGMLDGLDALLSTAQMPPGVPVAAMGVGSAGAINAAHLALRVLALSDPALAKKVHAFKDRLASQVEDAAAKLARERSK